MPVNDLADLKRQHAEAMERLYEAIAVSRGAKDFVSMDDKRKDGIREFATKLCAAWDSNPGLRENGIGDSFVMLRVAEQFQLARAIMAAENNVILAQAGTTLRPPKPRRTR